MPDANGKPKHSDANTPNPLLGNTIYDIVKDVVTLGFPAFITLYAGLGLIFGWYDVDKWVAALGLIGTFLGVLLKIAAKKYEGLPIQYDGALIANDPNPDNDTYRLEFDKGLVQMSNQDQVRLKVVDLLPAETAAPATTTTGQASQ